MTKIFSIFLVIFGALTANAQWKQLYHFPAKTVFPGHFIRCIYFLNLNNAPPKIGFAGIGEEHTMKTTDGGYTWHDVEIKNGSIVAGVDFSFKDSLTGWLANWYGIAAYKTTDAGESWSQFPDNNYFINVTGIHYQKSNNRIITANYGSNIVEFDEVGNVLYDKTPAGLGIVFADDSFGICSPISWANGPQELVFTTDGGLSWQQSSFVNDCWQPAAFKDTKTFFLCNSSAHDVGNLIWRSTDGGLTWENLYHYPTKDYDYDAITAVIRVGLNNTLLIQTEKPNSEGIMKSTDGGYTWVGMCGPVGYGQSRFFVQDSFIYAADRDGNLWLNTTGIGSNSTPQISSTNVSFKPLGCTAVDSLISLTFFDSCNGIQGELKNISLSGGGKFSIVSGEGLRQLHENDSMLVRCDPNAIGSDTAFLKLTFHLGFKDFDTTITLAGSTSNGPEQVKFLLPNTLTSKTGERVSLDITPDKTITGRGLTSITFDLVYNGDLLTEPQIVCAVGDACATGTEIVNGKQTRLPITITGNDLSLDLTKAITSISFRAMLTDTSSTPIVMTNLKLNNGDINYSQCILSADTTSTTFTETLVCGEKTVQKYLQIGRFISINSITPNPTNGIVQLDYSLSEARSITIEVFDILGNQVLSEERASTNGKNHTAINLESYPNGTYYLRLTTGSESVSSKVVVNK